MVFLGASSILSNLGLGTKINFESIMHGKRALHSETFDFSPDSICCSIIKESSLQAFNAKAKDLTRLEKMMGLVIQEVIDASKVSLASERTLLIISTTKGNIDILETKSGRKNGEYLSSIATKLSEEFNCMNRPLVLSNACISGLLAIIMGYRLIESKQYDDVIVCGGDLVSEFTLSGFKSFNALSD